MIGGVFFLFTFHPIVFHKVGLFDLIPGGNIPAGPSRA